MQEESTGHQPVPVFSPTIHPSHVPNRPTRDETSSGGFCLYPPVWCRNRTYEYVHLESRGYKTSRSPVLYPSKQPLAIVNGAGIERRMVTKTKTPDKRESYSIPPLSFPLPLHQNGFQCLRNSSSRKEKRTPKSLSV